MSELKPCPFCGREFFRGLDDCGRNVIRHPHMRGCTLSDTMWEAVPETIAALNRRAQPANSRFAECHIWEPGDRLDTLSDKCDVLIKAADIKALIAQPANEPLTLDELRGMDGVPVWIEVDGRPDLNKYCMVRRTDIGVIAIGAAATTVYGDDGQLVFEAGTYYDIERGNLYGVTWLAYRRKPEEAHDAQ